MYKIGIFSKMNRVTVKTLRYYDEIGLLKPSFVDDFTGYRYDAFNSLYPEMGEYMEQQNVKCSNPPYCFTLYHDGEYKETDINVEICEAVVDRGQDSDRVKFKRMDAVRTAACLFHKGPYSTIGLGYGAVMKWIEENGYEVAGMPRESYIDGIWNKEDQEDWLTEIQVPVTLKNGK